LVAAVQEVVEDLPVARGRVERAQHVEARLVADAPLDTRREAEVRDHGVARVVGVYCTSNAPDDLQIRPGAGYFGRHHLLPSDLHRDPGHLPPPQPLRPLPGPKWEKDGPRIAQAGETGNQPRLDTAPLRR